MIQSLTISNFLSHQSTKIEFSDGVNIIIGPTDSGKSAIIKALKWLIQNRPLGDGLRSSWGGNTVVSIEVDLVTVTRIRDKSTNGYKIGESEFNAIKGDIPSEVLQLLNLSEINIQTQFDSHFLLGKSPGEVAQYFNKVAHLDRIDSALQNIQKWNREVQRKLDYNTEALNGAKERLNAYGCLDSIETILISLEEKENRRERIYKDRESLLKLIKSIRAVDLELEEVDFLSDLDERVESCLKVIKKQKEKKLILSSLWAAVQAGRRLIQDVMNAEKELADMEERFHKALGKGSVCPLCEQVIK